MQKVFLIVFASFVSVAIYAQPDYAVTIKGDTLKGSAKILTYDLLDRVQMVVDKKKKNYTALEIKALSIKGEIFHTVKYDKGYRYMKLLKSGFLSLYGFRLTNQSSYDGQYLLKKDGAGMEVPNLTFKKSMTSYLSDCDEVSQRIKSGDLGRRDVEQIVERFNSCLQFKTERRVEEAPPIITVEEDEKMMAVNALITKVEVSNSLENKTDMVDLLKDLRSKIARKEILPNYITKDIKNTLSEKPEFKEEVEKLMVLLKK